MEKRTTPTDQTHKTPTTLLEAVRYFADENVAHSYAAKLRWTDGPSCPRCECREYSYLTTRKLWKCKGCKYQYSLKVNTIFEDPPLGFEKWLPAIWLLTNAKNGISSHELGRALGVHQETAWHMLGRIRHAMDTGTFESCRARSRPTKASSADCPATCTPTSAARRRWAAAPVQLSRTMIGPPGLPRPEALSFRRGESREARPDPVREVRTWLGASSKSRRRKPTRRPSGSAKPARPERPTAGLS